MARVLIVDDEQNMRWVLQEAMTRAGYLPESAASGQEALVLLARMPIDLVILDLKLKGMDGLATLRQLHARWPDMVVIILTAFGSVATAVEALQNGAADYLRKPFDVEELVFKISRALERRSLQQEVARLQQASPPMLAGSHPLWRRAVEAALQAVNHQLDLRLVGEMGSGRATIARSVHAVGARQHTPCVELDLATLPSDGQVRLLEGTSQHGGFWATAGQGVLLLRHAGALSADGQATLTRLRERRAEAGVGPLLITTGAPDDLPDPRSAEVRVPPLREHLDDVLLLAAEWLGEQRLTPAAAQMLESYPWPGNIAELRGVIERASKLAHGQSIEERHLPAHVRATPLPNTPFRLPSEGIHLEELEISLIQQALALSGGNKSRAAELLGLTRHTLLYRLEKYHIGNS